MRLLCLSWTCFWTHFSRKIGLTGLSRDLWGGEMLHFRWIALKLAHGLSNVKARALVQAPFLCDAFDNFYQGYLVLVLDMCMRFIIAYWTCLKVQNQGETKRPELEKFQAIWRKLAQNWKAPRRQPTGLVTHFELLRTLIAIFSQFWVSLLVFQTLLSSLLVFKCPICVLTL